MKFIRYFFYLASNWNIRIALHIIRHEIRGEKKYGIITTGADELSSLDKKGIDISHATIYMPVSYDLLEDIFTKVGISSFRHFLDIGCGKGRAMCMAATSGLQKVTGTDISKEFCEATKTNLEKIKEKFPEIRYTVFNYDAFYFEIEDGVDCIFMFNPFDDVIMSGVLENIGISLENNPRTITIIYINPLQKHLFMESGYREIYHVQKLHYLEGVVYQK